MSSAADLSAAVRSGAVRVYCRNGAGGRCTLTLEGLSDALIPPGQTYTLEQWAPP